MLGADLTTSEKKALVRAAMKIIASKKTTARAAASRRNGKLGGRPKGSKDRRKRVRKKTVDKPTARL